MGHKSPQNCEKTGGRTPKGGPFLRSKGRENNYFNLKNLER